MHIQRSIHTNKTFFQFKRTTFSVISSSGLEFFSPGDPRYMTEKISTLLAECNVPGEMTCSIDEDTLRIIHFENGNQVPKVGFFVSWLGENTGARGYDYYSYAIRNNVAFEAWTRFFWNGGEAGLMPCAHNPGGTSCENPELPLTQLSQMVAVHLTTFADLGDSGSVRSLETQFEYDPLGNDPSTFGVGYFEGNTLRFYNLRGKIWHQNTPGRTNIYKEYRRDADYVLLRYGAERAKIPVGGGEYYRSNDSGQTWEPAGSLVRK